MARPGKRAQRREEFALELACEWGSCQEIFDGMDRFCYHLETHYQDLITESKDPDILEDVHSCLWQNCGFCSVECDVELLRHMFFHCYHTKLKQWGTAMLKAHPDLGDCSVGLQNRNIVPEVPNSFFCLWEYCEMTMDNPEWFYRHVEMHAHCLDATKENILFCGWKGCESSFKGRFKLREHMRSHTQEKMVACPTCGGMFANNTKFFDHIQRQTIEGQKFQCAHCLKRFATERLLRDHMRNHVNHYKCPLCDMTCSSPSSLRNHIKFRHSTEKPYSCDYCKYSCKNLIDLRKHLETHSNEPAYHCDFADCDYSTRSLNSIKNHYKRVHEGDYTARYKCHVCEQCFTRGNSLTAHLHKKHHFEWPSGHPRFRYKEHADGFMRLQLIRYESVELTTRRMEERPKKGDRSESVSQKQCRQSGEDSGETEHSLTADENTKMDTGRDKDIYCRWQEDGDNALPDLISSASSTEIDSNREEYVMQQL